MGRISTRLDAWIFPRSNPRWLMQRLYFASNHAVGIYIYKKMRFPRKYLLPLMASIYASPVSCYTTSRYLARIKLHAIYFPGCCELCVRDRGREQRCVVSEREFFFFLLFFSEVGFRGKWNVGWMKSVLYFVLWIWIIELRSFDHCAIFFFSFFFFVLDAECSLLFPMRCLNFTFYRCRVFFCRLVGYNILQEIRIWREGIFFFVKCCKELVEM